MSAGSDIHEIHQTVCKAAAVLVMALVKQKASKAWLEMALKLLKEACNRIEALLK